MVDVYVARQPIFDRQEKVFGYELLFRGNKNNSYESCDGDDATIQLIKNSYSVIGIDNLTNGKRAFINFTENLITSDVIDLLPKDSVVIEILENVRPTEAVVKACKNLKKKGYILALDDYVYEKSINPLISLVDIVKVDFLLNDDIKKEKIYKMLKSNFNIKVLAEKIETIEEYHRAMEIGYDYFQGYFFSRPNILSGYDFPQQNIYSFKILKELNEVEVNFDNIEKIFKTDVTMSYKLLKFINSAKFYFPKEITSIRQAIVLLGKDELMKWILLVSLSNINKMGNSELMTISIIRGKFCEIISSKCDNTDKSSAFMVGSLSILDAILDKPIGEIIKDLPLKLEIKNAIMGDESYLGNILKLIKAYERGELGELHELSYNIGLNSDFIQELSHMYVTSLIWADDVINK
ncbi:EAL domain-containing protein [Clostridium sp. MSJ-4]|uniref:EAL domain-containing protein n=1 Tax=Clostridium simiarum TaxID=2841506 RepID=A0ABS6F2W2_9CLOT|nr:HDOD domain-containing protein [Clostridium simiarum]MBU5592836.1 EAL domain-containing protein [Clostridium simiarum]